MWHTGGRIQHHIAIRYVGMELGVTQDTEESFPHHNVGAWTHVKARIRLGSTTWHRSRCPEDFPQFIASRHVDPTEPGLSPVRDFLQDGEQQKRLLGNPTRFD